ncbi:uncharacterized protein N7459_003643 [Penicillium hispanicum]|uniref:uncharacterized protein n=1 Tax=Penicillium hispanicum TaxID=1080232 RepID=UPI00254213F0|nr:uncharacterized protein N7459_003643 [Penicillium hispanicum]KAJ5587878.1 hypothetical protein N7459_003643 [Penicillium hispanicum]
MPQAIPKDPDDSELLEVKKRYAEERAKRLRDDGNAQFIDISLSARHERFAEDPWVNPAAIEAVQSKFPNSSCEMLIIGAGWGGLQYAIRMVEAGIRPDDLRIIDPAGGFGGTWYWNRYPGVMCDIESYSYLPLLEETGFVPKQRYSHGEEIRSYANLVARKWGLADCGVFQTKAQKLVWDEAAKEWQVELVQQRAGHAVQHLSVRSRFVATATGVLNWPKLPDLPGILHYTGNVFHTSRWAYDVTGGSPTDPSLTKLQDKRVAIIGTGASSVQVVPHLARWSKHLYVLQRTPAAVDRRDQRETDEEWFRKTVAQSKCWQRERMKNFHQHFTLDEQPEINLVDDGWTRAPGLVGLAGNANGPKSLEEVAAYTAKLYDIDHPRQSRIRVRVDEQVKDPAIAAKLKPWYPSWCKRPLFHDEYLDTFNRDNVTLVDTDGKGIDSLTEDSITVGNESYPVDVIVFATGFRAPAAGSSADKANMTVVGTDGISMSEEWDRVGPTTLHGVLDAKFPNFFLSGPAQASLSGNYRFNLDELAKNAAYIIAESKRRADGKPFAVAPTAEAAEAWATQVMMHGAPLAVVLGCTPGYGNLEGDIDRAPVEKQMVMARSGIWGWGIEDFVAVIEAWRAEGDMQGIEVRV